MRNRWSVVCLFAFLLFAPLAAHGQKVSLDEVWWKLSEEPCLRSIVEKRDAELGMLIYLLHSRHRYHYPLRDFCFNGKSFTREEIQGFMDKWSYIKEKKKKTRSSPPTFNLRFMVVDGLPLLIYVDRDGPAFEAGLRRGDLLMSLDGTRFRGMNQALKLFSLPPGRVATIAFWRDGITRHTEVDTRVSRTPTYRMYRFGSYVYLEVNELRMDYQRIRHDLRRAYLDFPFSGIILDFQGCIGGYVYEAELVSGWFLGDTTNYLETVPTKNTYFQEVQTLTIKDHLLEQTLKSVPLVVLVSRDTFSACEIIAGAVQHHKRALLIGSRTGGKGTILTPFDWTAGRKLFLATSLWYTPNGTTVEDRGLDPDLGPESHPEVIEKFRNTCDDACDLLEHPEMQTAFYLLDRMQ
ncbi:MAG: S41 family peptidase [Patescibacteria group bacterium]